MACLFKLCFVLLPGSPTCESGQLVLLILVHLYSIWRCLFAATSWQKSSNWLLGELGELAASFPLGQSVFLAPARRTCPKELPLQRNSSGQLSGLCSLGTGLVLLEWIMERLGVAGLRWTGVGLVLVGRWTGGRWRVRVLRFGELAGRVKGWRAVWRDTLWSSPGGKFIIIFPLLLEKRHLDAARTPLGHHWGAFGVPLGRVSARLARAARKLAFGGA